MLGLIRKLFPQKILVAVSKPDIYTITHTGYKPPTPVTVRLYLTGMTRSYEIHDQNGNLVRKKSQPLDFWVATGEFPGTDENNFGWVLSPRELKKKLLADLIAMDVDK